MYCDLVAKTGSILPDDHDQPLEFETEEKEEKEVELVPSWFDQVKSFLCCKSSKLDETVLPAALDEHKQVETVSQL